MKKITREEFALDVSGYANHITDAQGVILDVYAGAPTLNSIVPSTGNKAGDTVTIKNGLDTDLFWDTSDCNATFSGDTTIAPRYATMVRLNDRQELCPQALDAKLPHLAVACAREEDISFSEALMDLKVAKNSKELEKLAWRGNLTATTVSGNLTLQDGWLAIGDTETSDLGYYNTFTAISASNVIVLVREMLDNRTEDMMELDNILYVSDQVYGYLSAAIVDTYGIAGTGLFTNSGEASEADMLFPGYANVKIRRTHGLNSNDSMFMTTEGNLTYLVDCANDNEEVDMFFDKYNKSFVTDLTYSVAFQYFHASKVVYLKKV